MWRSVDVTNIRAIGKQEVSHPLAAVEFDLRNLYWCEAEFRAIAVVKGKLPLMRMRYLWASVNPSGCRVYYGAREGYERLLTRNLVSS